MKNKQNRKYTYLDHYSQSSNPVMVPYENNKYKINYIPSKSAIWQHKKDLK